MTEADLIQLQRIANYVKTWDTYQQFVSGESGIKPMLNDPLREDVKKKTAGSS
jgi:hypothetical protein